MPTIKDIQESAQTIIRLLGEYQGETNTNREMRIDPMVYAFFEAKFGNMSRQHRVKMHSKPKPQRIDFRYGSSNPVVIEFAVRHNGSLGTLYGSQNLSELRKLTRVIPSQAKRRILLLIDFASDPLKQESLKPTYDSLNAGQGNFKRHSVRIIYVHREVTYHFVWWPRRD